MIEGTPATADDPETHLSLSGCHIGYGSDGVEAAHDTETTSGPGDHSSYSNATNWMWMVRGRNRVGEYANALISQYTGAQSRAFPFQTTAPTSSIQSMSAVQIMYMHVPTFPASKCQYRGTRVASIPSGEIIKKRMLVAIILVHCLENRSEETLKQSCARVEDRVESPIEG